MTVLCAGVNSRGYRDPRNPFWAGDTQTFCPPLLTDFLLNISRTLASAMAVMLIGLDSMVPEVDGRPMMTRSASRKGMVSPG